ncbi:uncharacterized protein LOC110699443 [Chenopodium quinoa]|uniref:uncharacterized protein LOC110699443 n=1 Tax=Chenopodium quinoa TaxID=63459 RepID=UPI000B798A7B|nr:uncharacterized protein LOC110699443 [Chenopodium quinoa]
MSKERDPEPLTSKKQIENDQQEVLSGAALLSGLAANPFAEESQRQADVFITHIEDIDVIVGDDRRLHFNEIDEHVDEPRQDDVPSVSGVDSIRTFRSNEMGYESTPHVILPDVVRDKLKENQDAAVETYGDLSGFSEVEKAKICLTQAVARASEILFRVPDPITENFKLLLQVVQNHVITAGLNDELKRTADTAEHQIRIAKAAQKRAEDAASDSKFQMEDMIEKFHTFLREMEHSITPYVEQGQDLTCSDEVVDIPSFKVRIQKKMDQAITSRDQMIKDLDEQNSLFRIEAGKRQTGLETEIKRLKELVSSTEISLSEAQKQITLIKEQNDLKRSEFETEINNLKHTISSDNLRLMEVQKQLQTEKDHLENARELLKTRIYTQEQYNEGYENGYKVARRLAIHLEPNINWELAEEWSMDLNHPNMQRPHANELALLARLSEKDDFEEDDDDEVEKIKPQIQDVRTAASSVADTKKVPDANIVDAGA